MKSASAALTLLLFLFLFHFQCSHVALCCCLLTCLLTVFTSVWNWKGEITVTFLLIGQSWVEKEKKKWNALKHFFFLFYFSSCLSRSIKNQTMHYCISLYPFFFLLLLFCLIEVEIWDFECFRLLSCCSPWIFPIFYLLLVLLFKCYSTDGFVTLS